MLASPKRDATRAISPDRCRSLAWTISASTYVSCSLSSTVLAVDGLSTMNRVTLFPPDREGLKCEDVHFASASARQNFPSVLGRSSINTVNSLVAGIVGTSLASLKMQNASSVGVTLRLAHPRLSIVQGCLAGVTPLKVLRTASQGTRNIRLPPQFLKHREPEH